jgi:Cu(I)/Ag(I) efflux system periplasmic protein CusF
MKSVFAIVAAALLAASTSAIAQTATTTPDAREKNEAYTEGEVRKVDKDAGKITLKHGAIANLDMPPMSMVFRAADAAMLDKVKEGDKVRFKAEKIQGAYTVTRIEPAK